MKKMNPVVHFEIPAENRQRIVNFYSEVFGWEAQMMGEEMGEYVVVTTSETDDNGRPKMAGTINGGFYLKSYAKPPHYPSVVIAVDDIDESIQRIKNAGGEVVDNPVDIPGVGKFVSFTDSEGNRLSILKPLMP
jgi:predicted enzyme related to lactoylglutathione lyase